MTDFIQHDENNNAESNANPAPWEGFTILSEDELSEIEALESRGGAGMSEETNKLLSGFAVLKENQAFLFPVPEEVADVEKYRHNIKTRLKNYGKSADVKVNGKDKTSLKIKRVAPKAK
jgi:hypothetical protein